MSIAGFFASGVWSVIFGLLLLVFIVLALYSLAVVDGLVEKPIAGGFFLLLTGLSLWGFIFSMTHRVIQVNERAMVYDTTSGSIVGGMRDSGIKRDRELFEADTRVQVANRVATGQKDAMQTLGIKSEEGVLQWFMIQWLQALPNPPANLPLSLGGEKIVPAVSTK